MTSERISRLAAALDRRQPDLTVVLDNVNKPHNFSAILRSCDAVGVLEAHAVWPGDEIEIHRLCSGGAAKWLRVRLHRAASGAIAALRARGFAVVAASPAADAADFREVDYTVPTALLLGAELDGISDSALALADRTIRIPMSGLAESLNVSVAAALVLFEAQRQRAAAGLYEVSRLDPELRTRTLFEWAQPQVAAYCRSHDLPYPPLDEAGAIAGEFRR